jgi:hypothetical protein
MQFAQRRASAATLLSSYADKLTDDRRQWLVHLA